MGVGGVQFSEDQAAAFGQAAALLRAAGVDIEEGRIIAAPARR